MAENSERIVRALRLLSAFERGGPELAGVIAAAIVENNPALAPFQALLAEEISAALNGLGKAPSLLSRLLRAVGL